MTIGLIKQRQLLLVQSQRKNLIFITFIDFLLTIFGCPTTLNWLANISGKRNKIATFWPDCLRKYGDIYVGRVLSDDKIEGVRFNGTEPADRLFTELCQAGMPIAKRMEDGLTPQQKAARERQTESTIRSLFSR